MARRVAVPSLRRHSPSKQGVVRLNGLDHYLGRWPEDCPEAPPDVREKYDQTIAKWLGRGRHLPQPENTASQVKGLTIGAIILAYWPTVAEYYRHPDGTPTTEVSNIRLALRRLRRLYSNTQAAAFDSLALEALREHMIQEGLCRGRINRDIPRIKRMFQWAASKKLVPAETWQLLTTVKGLRAGRSSAEEREPVRPVADELVGQTLPHLSPPIAAMVRLQRFCGMRPGEAVVLRPCDVDQSGPVWLYRPGSDRGPNGQHKTAWRGHQRNILIGPRGQEVLKPFLVGRNPEQFCFSPVEGRAAHDVDRRSKRKSKVPPSQQGQKRKKNPKKAPRQRYTTSTYSQAVADGCRKNHCLVCSTCKRRGGEKRVDWVARVEQCPDLKPVCWHPNQLRHTAGTELRKVAGLDTSRAVLGQRSPAVTVIYAEADMEKAAAIMEQFG